MGYLKEGPELDVTVEERTLNVDGYDVSIVHARPDGMPRAGVNLDIRGLAGLFQRGVESAHVRRRDAAVFMKFL